MCKSIKLVSVPSFVEKAIEYTNGTVKCSLQNDYYPMLVAGYYWETGFVLFISEQKLLLPRHIEFLLTMILQYDLEKAVRSDGLNFPKTAATTVTNFACQYTSRILSYAPEYYQYTALYRHYI